MLSLHPQPVNKTQNALPEIRRAAHHSRALPRIPRQCTSTLAHQVRPKEKEKYLNELWPPRDMRRSPAIMREFEPVTYIHIEL